ncbi:MAG TPA: proton-conducting transporter membrane subunit [Geobacteraceae bacterium]|nr:proton-conducting transporter membrane subunit [Geobacteraceae bacterium]
MISIVLISVSIMLLGGLAALFARNSFFWSTALGAGGAIAGCVAGLVPAMLVTLGTPAEYMRLSWDVPYGTFYLGLDPLSAFFLLPTLGLCALAALYGGGYLQAWRGRKALGAHWFFFNLLAASMVMVIVARNGVLFLMCWEVMSLASFFLVTFENEKESVRDAGWIYLVATHLGTAFLLVLFVLMGRETGAMDFGRPGMLAGLAPSVAGLMFMLALIGFGTKAGLMPLHVWLPEAHPAAPSHVSAVMSGVMIKTGIYGILRVLTFLGPPPAWWGWLLVAAGVSSGILGVLFALAQHDLKRLLAYHSVENIGIITLGIGVGVLGMQAGSRTMVVLGFGGALLHVINHAVFKGLLFLGAGAVQHATGTLEIDHLGGLLKRMPWTGATFLIGAAAISGLPPLNGFVSEFLIYLGAFHGGTAYGLTTALSALATIAALALIGGLAAACFAKAFGIVFLGEPRGGHAIHAHEAGPAMTAPMVLLAAGCLVIGLSGPWIINAMAPVLVAASGLPPGAVRENLSQAVGPLSYVVTGCVVLLTLVATLSFIRRRLLASREKAISFTWDCGYATPTPRMQYTASSFAQPLIGMFRNFLPVRRRFSPPEGLFPAVSAFMTETPDIFREGIFRPAFAALSHGLSRVKWLQHGRVQLYILYIVITLLALLVWKIG